MYLEIIYQAFAVQEIVGDDEEVPGFVSFKEDPMSAPIERLAPWVATPCFFLILGSPLQGEQRGHLMIHQHLTHKDKYNHIGMSHEQETCSICQYPTNSSKSLNTNQGSLQS